MHEEEFEDTKGVVRIRKLKKGQTSQWPKEKRQKDKQWSTNVFCCMLNNQQSMSDNVESKHCDFTATFVVVKLYNFLFLPWNWNFLPHWEITVFYFHTILFFFPFTDSHAVEIVIPVIFATKIKKTMRWLGLTGWYVGIAVKNR